MLNSQIQVMDRPSSCQGHSQYLICIKLFEMNWWFMRFNVVHLVELLGYLIALLKDYLPIETVHSDLLNHLIEDTNAFEFMLSM